MRRFLLLLATALVASLFAAPVAGAQTEEGGGDFTAEAIDDDQVSDRVGLVDPVTGMWHLRGAGGVVNSFFYGNPGDFPIAGDWDCDGVATPGLYRQSDGFVYLRNSNSQGIADIRFFFGNPSDIPLAGDFNGDGCDTISIYRPSEARIYIINELGANNGGLGAADFSYVFGNPGDKPFVGDFNGDSIDTVGLHRESTGFVYFRNSHTQGVADAEFFFGDPGDRLVAGDWGVVDDVDTPAVFRPTINRFFFRYTNTQGNANEQFVMGEFRMLPVAGPWEIKLGLGGGTLPKAIKGIPYARTLSPVGGEAPYTVQKLSAPSWVSVNNAGRISGTPPALGIFNLVVRVTDGTGKSVDQTIPITVQDGCDSNTTLPNPECLALVDLYRKTNGNGWIEKTNWFATDPCTGPWFGVTCAGGHVTSIVLEGTAGNGNNLTGTIATVPWGNLTGLTELNLQHNLIQGAMPGSLATLQSLRVLDVSSNGLGPSIPTFTGPANLLELDLAENAFTGSIAGVAAETSLTLLDLASNTLNDGIDAAVANMDALLTLDLSENAFIGTIPASIGTLTRLTELSLSENQFSGEVPNLTALTRLLPDGDSLGLCPNGALVITIPGNQANRDFVDLRDSLWVNTSCTA